MLKEEVPEPQPEEVKEEVPEPQPEETKEEVKEEVPEPLTLLMVGSIFITCYHF